MIWLIWSIVALLAVFVGSMLVLLAREMIRLRAERRDMPERSLVRRYAEYIGPIDRSAAPLSPGLRVAAEFLAALAGFPGIGWMVSGRIAVGLPLMIAVPAALWLFYPLYVSTMGIVLERPLAVLAILPPVAVLSAGSLAALELRRERAR